MCGYMATTYTPTIGLEIHAELKTRTKMFCGSRNAPHEEAPNTHVCPICMGHPGTLPTINRQAVAHVLLVGRALNGRLAEFTEFDRKNYFYPDIPKGYQISQFAFPLVSGGSLDGVAVTRVHLEEDTARSQHDKATGSLIDFNRAGVPLMELVTEPVMHDAQTAGHFARELQLLLRSLDVSDANMERGEMRVEVNISMSATDTLGTKVEVKNINSFRSVEGAIAHEMKRQVALLEAGEMVIQETRGWDEIREVTVSQRKKESSHDYRYFPDPDLPKLNLNDLPILSESRVDELLKETPYNKRIKLSNLGLPSNVIEVLIANLDADHFYTKCLDAVAHVAPPQNFSVADDILKEARKSIAPKLANYLTSDLLGYIGQNPQYSFATASPEAFSQLILWSDIGALTSRVTKDLILEIVFRGIDLATVVMERGLMDQSSEADLDVLIDAVLAEHVGVVVEYRKGKEASLQFLIGQCMKVTKGKVNPLTLKMQIEKRIAMQA